MLVLIVVILAACTNNEITGKVVSEQETIKIGIMYPLSGGAAAFGIPSKQGVELAVKEINQKGGINNKKIELIIEDSGCDPTKGVNAINKLIYIDKVKYIIGDICSAVVVPTAPIAEQNNVIIMAQGSSPDITPIGDYIFRNWPSDIAQANVMAKYINKIGIKKIVVINVNNPYGNGLGDSFTKKFEKQGGEIVLTNKFEPDTTDFRTILTKTRSSEAEAIYIVSQAGEAGYLAKQMNEMNIDLPIYGGDDLNSKNTIDASQGTLEDAVCALPYIDEEDTEVKRFIQRYETKFNKEPDFLLVSAIAYDAMNLIATAMENTPYERTDIVKDNLYKIKKYPGISGATTIDKNGDVIKPYGIYRIVNGKTKLIAKSKV